VPLRRVTVVHVSVVRDAWRQGNARAWTIRIVQLMYKERGEVMPDRRTLLPLLAQMCDEGVLVECRTALRPRVGKAADDDEPEAADSDSSDDGGGAAPTPTPAAASSAAAVATDGDKPAHIVTYWRRADTPELTESEVGVAACCVRAHECILAGFWVGQRDVMLCHIVLCPAGRAVGTAPQAGVSSVESAEAAGGLNGRVRARVRDGVQRHHAGTWRRAGRSS
jgi:hypothetical protein